MISAAGSIAPVVLAAGASSRLGEPKALADIGGLPVLAHVLSALESCTESFLPPSIVIGRHAAEISAARLVDPHQLIHNVSWQAGRTGSFFRGASQHRGKDILLWPVDVPLVAAGTLDELARAWAASGQPPTGWLAPSYADGDAKARYGHPVLIGAALAEGAGDLREEQSLKDLRARSTKLLSVRVNDGAVLDDLDTPADLARLRNRAAR